MSRCNVIANLPPEEFLRLTPSDILWSWLGDRSLMGICLNYLAWAIKFQYEGKDITTLPLHVALLPLQVEPLSELEDALAFAYLCAKDDTPRPGSQKYYAKHFAQAP